MHGDFDFDQMFAAQWAAMTITTNPYIGISPSAPAIQSYSDLDTAIKGQGEFGYFQQVVQKSTDPTLDPSVSEGYFSFQTSYGNMMNPANLQIFFDKYEEKNYQAIMRRF